MDGNKDEALRCVNLAKTALASRDRQRALKFIRIAQRLDPGLPLADLLATTEQLETLNGTAHQEKIGRGQVQPKESASSSNVDRGYTEEHVRVIRDIRKNKDYYSILGVERSCSVEEIRKAYRKLSLKVHPDKNKAPGAEDAFKSVSKAFKCLSNEQSRKTYDQTGAIDDHEFNEQYSNVMRQRAATRRRQARSSFYDYEEDFDPDEIFRSFFYGTHDNLFRAHNAYRRRGMGMQQQQRDSPVHGGLSINFAVLMHLMWILAFALFAFLPLRQPEYSLNKTHYFPISKVTEKHGVEYFVGKLDFDQQFPQGSPSRYNLEQYVFKDYKSLLGRRCHMELQRRRWVRDYPTPHCDRLRSLVAT